MSRKEAPKILYLEIDEEVTSIIDRMRSVSNEEIVLVIPHRATLLQSIVNLKLLKRQAEKFEKNMAIVTQDKTGRNLSSQIGITVYSDIEQLKGKSSTAVFDRAKPIIIKGEDIEEESDDILPADKEEVSVTENILNKSKKLREKLISVEEKEIEDRAEDISTEIEKNISHQEDDIILKSSFDVLEKSKQLREKLGYKKTKKESIPTVTDIIQEPIEERTSGQSLPQKEMKQRKKLFSFGEKSQKKESPQKEAVRYKDDGDNYNVMSLKLLSPNKKFLFFMLFVSMFVLFIVGYFVLPNATVEIQSKIEPISYTSNISMLDINRYQSLLDDGEKLKFIGSYPIEIKELALTEQVPATGKRFTGGRATGTIQIQNKIGRAWQFVQNTRFASPEGIVFRTLSGVTVPGNGTTTVQVIADETDEQGTIIGARGNLSPTQFTIPGLGAQSPAYVFGVSTEAFVGGSDDFETVVTDGDIEAAKKIIVDKLREIAEQKVVERIDQENQKNNTHLKLFKTGKNDSDIRFEVLEVIADTGLIGKPMESFPIAAKVRLNGIAYNIDEVVTIMDTGIRSMVLDNRELIELQKDGIEFYVKENLPGTQKIEVEATLHGVVRYKVDERLSTRIKENIMGKNIEESLEILENMPEIGGARIETWPFWVRNIPSFRSNIKVIQLDE